MVRPGEARGAKHAEFDLDKAVSHIPEMEVADAA
jgi:hypothetical protein